LRPNRNINKGRMAGMARRVKSIPDEVPGSKRRLRYRLQEVTAPLVISALADLQSDPCIFCASLPLETPAGCFTAGEALDWGAVSAAGC
jgi:hypothetical protein